MPIEFGSMPIDFGSMPIDFGSIDTHPPIVVDAVGVGGDGTWVVGDGGRVSIKE